MAQIPSLYREVRLAPHPVSPDQVLDIDTTNTYSTNANRRSLLRAGSKRSFADISDYDEETYARHHLATEGSVYFRSHTRSPRAFLWRLLDERKVLQIQAVDLVKNRTHAHNADSWLTFRVHFPEGILEKGVVFADPEETDALEAYVLTAGRELVTVTLRRDLLVRASAPNDFDSTPYVKRYSSSFLSVRQPYRFVAVNHTELLVSLADGGLVRLERKANDSGVQWRETFFSEGGWRGTLTLRGINPFAGRQTVRHGNLELELNTISDMAKSPDGKLVWAISLDHKLRAWSTTSGKVVYQQDLLNQPEQEGRRQPYVMSAEQGRLLQIVTPPVQSNGNAVARTIEGGERYAVVVHSPRDHHFKIYECVATHTAEGEALELQDLGGSNQMVPPLDEILNTNIWHLESFHLEPGPEWQATKLWLQIRSGALARTFMLEFDLLDEQGNVLDTTDIWARGWSVIESGPLTAETLRHSDEYPVGFATDVDGDTTPSERWLEFLFRPGRFVTAELETALNTYCKGRKVIARTSTVGRGLRAADQPLQERLITAITCRVLLHRLPGERPDYARYHQEVNAQWQNFYLILSDLHTRRHEPVVISYDSTDRLLWTVCADHVAPVRALSGIEKSMSNAWLLHDDKAKAVDESLFNRALPEDSVYHKSADLDEQHNSSRLLQAARRLRSSLSHTARTKQAVAAYKHALSALDVDGDYQVLDDGPIDDLRTRTFSEKWAVDIDEITDDAFNALVDDVESIGGLGSLDNNIFKKLIDWLDRDGTVAGADSGRTLGPYGAKMTIQVAREMLSETQESLLDLLTLLAFMAGGIEAEELDEGFRPDVLYAEIHSRLKTNVLLLWLANHERKKTLDLAKSPVVPEHHVETTVTLSLLEDFFISDWTSHESASEVAEMPTLLTEWSAYFVQGLQFEEQRWPGATAHILARLIKERELDLATDFLQFVDRSTDWLLYLQARLQLLIGAYAQASVDFKEAVDGLARGEPQDTANLLSAIDRQGFGSGATAYYQHVMALFEKLKLYSYVVDFASLALQHMDDLPDLESSMADIDARMRAHDSPAKVRITAAEEQSRLLKLVETKCEILSRMFEALLQTGRLTEAYDALSQIVYPDLKRSCLKKLVDACLKQDAVPTLLSLPLEKSDLVHEVDQLLSDRARRELSLLPSNHSAAGTPPADYQILYAFRTQRGDFRGAAEILYEQLQRLRRGGTKDVHLRTAAVVHDPEDETLLQYYTLLINTLACCATDDAWILAESEAEMTAEGRKKRKLVTLADVRREYMAEMDKRSEMLLGRFPLVGSVGDANDGEAMDVI